MVSWRSIGNTYDVVPLQDARERESIAERIGRIEASAQTNFFPALESCFRQLRDEEAEVKHVILISDGKTYPDDYQGLVTRMQEAEITVSTVGVGEEADRELLADIARWGKGKSYFVRDASRVQRILLDEARRKQTDTLVEKPTRAIPVSNAPLIADIDFEGAPELRGYVTYEPRDEGRILLETDSGAPLLAHRNVGLGHTWVFAADLKNRWVAPWLEWPQFANLLGGVLREMSAERFDPRFSMSLTRARDVVEVELTAVRNDGSFWDGLEPRLELSGVSSDSTTLGQVAPGLYRSQVTAPTDPSGDLRIGVWIDDERVAMGSVYTASPPEYRSGPPDLEQLSWLSEVTGGRFEPTWDELVSPMSDSATRRVRLAPWLLAAALIFYLLELLLHRTGRLRPRVRTSSSSVGAEPPKARQARLARPEQASLRHRQRPRPQPAFEAVDEQLPRRRCVAWTPLRDLDTAEIEPLGSLLGVGKAQVGAVHERVAHAQTHQIVTGSEPVRQDRHRRLHRRFAGNRVFEKPAGKTTSAAAARPLGSGPRARPASRSKRAPRRSSRIGPPA